MAKTERLSIALHSADRVAALALAPEFVVIRCGSGLINHPEAGFPQAQAIVGLFIVAREISYIKATEPFP
jgi:hypothetical protein